MNKSLDLGFHVPVLLAEVIENLRIEKDTWYIDATAGGGGHTRGILDARGNVLAIDQDEDAIGQLTKRFGNEIKTGRLKIRQGNFTEIETFITEEKLGEIKGILFDLGVSTYQIKQSGRGFSFRENEPLDMRMSGDETLTAAKILNHYSQEDLYEIFRKYGEEHLARPIAVAICRARAVSSITTTNQLVRLICEEYKKRGIRERIDPATRVFQALRIEVNDELNRLKIGLESAFRILGHKGRLIVISFHSLEDRIVKQFFLKQVDLEKGLLLHKRPITVSNLEKAVNRASRSARLRIIEKV